MRTTLRQIKDSIARAAPRLLLLVAIGAALLLVAKLPELAGIRGGAMAIAAPWAFGIGLVFLGLAAGDLALRILQPAVDPQAAAKKATDGCGASGQVYLGRCLLLAVVLVLTVTAARAGEPPGAAVPLLPVLRREQLAHWQAMPLPSALGAQVEQETGPCPGRSCWNPRAELKTSREQGIGLGQLTRAFRVDGSTRFDAMAEIRKAYPRELAALTWQAPYDPALQLRALVLKDLQTFDLVLGASSSWDRLAMALAAYNGGAGGLASDRRACAATRGCNPGKWFGNVERTSLKARAAVPGYGQSFFSINRAYVRNVLTVRRVRYGVLDAC